ncbi:MAG: right-handed parallel beta-helix repeat-containing protein [Cytophagaceae bacterium]
MKYLSLLLVLLFSIDSFSASYYVSTSGNDNLNRGTLKQPFRTIQKGATVAIAGDSVFIRAGKYKEVITIMNSGSQDAPIVFINYKNERVLIDGAGIHMPDSLIFENHYKSAMITLKGKNYIEIHGLHINNTEEMGIFGVFCDHILIKKNKTSKTEASAIMFRYCKNIRVDGNTVKDACFSKPEECISIAYVDTFEVLNNEVFQTDTTIKTFGGEGIDIKNGSKNGSVHHNTVHNLKKLGIYIDSYRKPQINVEVFNNVVYNCRNGIALSSELGEEQDNIHVYNNICYLNYHSGIIITSWKGNGKRKNISIYNNTLYRNGNTHSGGGITIESIPGSNISVTNNICYNNVRWQISARDSSKYTFENNLVFPFRNYKILWEVKGSNSVEANPLFVDELSFDLHLSEDSPARDKGKNSDLQFDFDKKKRPSGKGNDIGAFEY